MGGNGFFFQAFVYLLAAVISVPIAKRLGLGSILGYLIAGTVIGPFGLRLIGEEGQDVLHFAEFGVVMMLFVIGLELQPALLWRMRSALLALGGMQVAATSLVFAALAIFFGQPWPAALAIGMTLSLSSTAFVLPTLQEKDLLRTEAGQNSFAVLLFQDIAAIPMLIVMPLLAVHRVATNPAANGAALHDGQAPHAGSTSSAWIEGLAPGLRTLAVLAAVAGIVVLGHFLARPALRLIARTRLQEIFTAAALLLVIAIALLMTTVGLSPALGTFIAGVVLASSEYRHELEVNIAPFKSLLLGLFFIAVGASIDFHLVASRPGTILALVGGLVTIKFVILFALAKLFRSRFDQRLVFGIALAQGGEFAFVLFSFALQNGVLDPAQTSPLVAAVAISMAATGPLLLLNERLLLPRFGTKEKSTRKADDGHSQERVIIAGYGRFGQIVARLLEANGVAATLLEIDSDQVDLLRQFGHRVYYGDASRLDLLRSAGAESAAMLVLAIDDHQKLMDMARAAKKHFPNLRIVARARGRTEAYDLLELGINDVFRETFDSALRAGTSVLEGLGFRSYRARRSARAFRRYDERHMRELLAVRSDRTRYVSLAKERAKDLESTLAEDLRENYEARAVGWEVDSLKTARGPGQRSS